MKLICLVIIDYIDTNVNVWNTNRTLKALKTLFINNNVLKNCCYIRYGNIILLSILMNIDEIVYLRKLAALAFVPTEKLID